MFAFGETLEEREQGKAEAVVTNQIRLALDGISAENMKNIIIAYEPIWAIGTGKTATSQDAQNSIKEIRNKIEQIYGQTIARRVIIQYGNDTSSCAIILYGGSVKRRKCKRPIYKI